MERVVTDLVPAIGKTYFQLNRFLASRNVLPEADAMLRARSEFPTLRRHRPQVRTRVEERLISRKSILFSRQVLWRLSSARWTFGRDQIRLPTKGMRAARWASTPA
jgi:hypothetical protein